jgi:O-methyltransferase involved in polyketide biosynthesis
MACAPQVSRLIATAIIKFLKANKSSSLKWIEVDLPDTLAYKQTLLSNVRPACHLESVALDLTNAGSRRELFARLNQNTTRALVLSEGLLVYMPEEEVVALASDLGAQTHFHRPG